MYSMKVYNVWCVCFSYFALIVVCWDCFCVYPAHFISCCVLMLLLLCYFYPCTNFLLFSVSSPHKLSVVCYVVSLSFTKRGVLCCFDILSCTNRLLSEVLCVYPCTNRVLFVVYPSKFGLFVNLFSEFGFILQVNSNIMDVIY